MNRFVLPSLVALVASLLTLPISNAAPMAPALDSDSALNQSDPATEHTATGVAALNVNDLDAAQAAFKEATAANPRMPQPLLGLAEVAVRRGSRTEAKNWLDQAIRVAPYDDVARRALALFHITGKDYAAAEEALRETLTVNPRNLLAQIDLADLYANSLNRPSEALIAYRAAVAIDPTHAGAHNGLATMLTATGQFTEAEAEYRKAAELAPDVPVPLHLLARMQLTRGQTQAGLVALDAALKVQPTFVPALLDKGDILLDHGKPEAAIELYDQAVAADDKNAAAHYKRGAVLQLQRRDEEAKSEFLKAIALDDKFVAAYAYNNLAWMTVESGLNLDQAANWADKAVKLEPDNAAFRDTQGWVYRAQRKLAEAETVLEKAATMEPPVADIHYHLGMVYQDQKKPDQARRAFDAALAIDPKHAPSKAALQKLGDTVKQ